MEFPDAFSTELNKTITKSSYEIPQSHEHAVVGSSMNNPYPIEHVEGEEDETTPLQPLTWSYPTITPLTPPTMTFTVPQLFTIYHTYSLAGPSPRRWEIISSREIFKRENTPLKPILKSGRSRPPHKEDENWNVWTLGCLKFRYHHGGLHLDYLRRVLERVDGIHRRKSNARCLNSEVLAERRRQEMCGHIVDRPMGWNESSGWWVYIQPV